MLGILLAVTVVASPTTRFVPHPMACPIVGQQKTADRGAVGPKQLGDLPDAERYHAVWKTAGGCPIDEVWQNGRWVDRWAGAHLEPRQATRDDR